MLNVPLDQVVDVPGRMSPVAMCFVVVKPWPPFILAVCACDTDVSFHGALRGDLTVPSRLIVAIAIVLS